MIESAVPSCIVNEMPLSTCVFSKFFLISLTSSIGVLAVMYNPSFVLLLSAEVTQSLFNIAEQQGQESAEYKIERTGVKQRPDDARALDKRLPVPDNFINRDYPRE